MPHGSAGSGGAVDTDVVVRVTGTSFSPRELRVKEGTTVKWVWETGTHNVVSGTNCTSDGKFSSGAPRAAPYAGYVVFREEGTYDYFCSSHCGSGMTGKVIVTP